MRKLVKFTTEEKEEDIQLVLEALREGQSFREIAEYLGRSQSYIFNIKTLLIESGTITQEEIDAFSDARSVVAVLKNDVLRKFQDGKGIEEIAKELKISYSTVTKIRNLLIEEGLITLDEIKKLNRKASKREALKEKILQGFKSGKLSSEIASELRVSPTMIKTIKQELITQGLISEEEILNLQNKSSNERNSRILSKLQAGLSQSKIARQEGISQSRISELKIKFIKNGDLAVDTVLYAQGTSVENANYSQLSEQEKQIIDLLLKGLPLKQISKQLNIEQFDLSNTITQLKKGKYITSSQIGEARYKFKEDEETKILAFLREGYSQAEILQELTYLLSGTLYKRVSALVSSGKITQEEIEEAKGKRAVQKNPESISTKNNRKSFLHTIQRKK